MLKLEDISFGYGRKMILNQINYEFEQGQIYAIVGKSGVGKTTLLSLLSGLNSPKSGQILYHEKDIMQYNKYSYRSKIVGVIFQSFNLLTNLSALENVVLSMEIAGVKEKKKKQKAKELLELVGLTEEEMNRRILELSGGQQQRVAIARALSYDPEIILADEPTGNLDEETQNDIIKIFKGLAEQGKCVIIVIHSKEVAENADVVYELRKTC